MSRVAEALHWDGITPVASLFVVSTTHEQLDLTKAWGADTPRQTKTYCLEDDRPKPVPLQVYEYDFEFEVLPADLKHGLEECLRMACDGTGTVAWFAFEGSFHFDHILTRSVVDQIYGICATGDPPLVLLDDEPAAQTALHERMRAYRIRLGLD